jgi:hypothetical protein
LERDQRLEVPDDIEESKQPELGLMEVKIQHLLRIRETGNGMAPHPTDPTKVIPILGPRSYLAVLASRPGIELGLEDTREHAGYHLLLGSY